jgi:hypothetical protein
MSTNQKQRSLATQQGGPVSTQVEDFSADAGSGFEGAGAQDFAIPFLQILQGLSPQVKRSDGAYIKDAQEGMILNTVTNTVVDPAVSPLIVIPVLYRHTWVEWRLREKGGGFVGEHTQPPGETTRDDRGRDILANGNQLNDTRTFYVMVVDGMGACTPAVVSMTSTQIRKAKQWYMQMNLLKLKGPNGPYTPPIFASKWTVTTVPEANEKGSWFGWKFEHAGYLAGPTDPLFVEAKAFRESVVSGAVKVDHARAEDAAAGKTAARDPDTGEFEGEIPF